MDGSSLTGIPLECRPDCPWRPLDWRRRAAARLSSQAPAPRRHWLDGWVRRAARHYRAPDPAIAGALALRSGGTTRVVVEARVLAGQDAGAIGDRCGLDPSAVEAYERLFFAAGDVLDAKDYIVLSAMPGLRLAEGADDATIARWFGFFGGPDQLDVSLHVLGIREAPIGAEPGPQRIREALIAIAARRLGPGGATHRGMTRLIALSEELDRRDADDRIGPLCRPLSPAIGPIVGDGVDDAVIGLMPVAPIPPPLAATLARSA